MQKHMNHFINASMGTAVGFAILGLVFIILPGTSLEIIRWIIAIFFMVVGISVLVTDIAKRSFMPMMSSTILGTISLIVGVIFAAYPGVMNIFPIILGAWFVVSAVAGLRISASLQESATAHKVISVLVALLALACGVTLILYPHGGQLGMMMLVGIAMLTYSVATLIDLAVLKHNIKDLSKTFGKLYKELSK